jgi:hypothetical protein
MRGQPYTPCRLFYDSIRALNVGDYLLTPAGSAYLITAIRPSPSKPHRKHLECLRWPKAMMPDGARVHTLRWYRRTSTRGRSIAELRRGS